MTPWTSTVTTRAGSPIDGNCLTSSGASSSTTSGPKDAEGILMANTLLRESYSKLGRLRLRSTWPPGKPLDAIARLRGRTLRLILRRPLRLSGFITTSLLRACLPSLSTCSPLCTFLIYLMIEGAIAPFPPSRGSPYSSPRRLHPNGTFSRDFQGGVPKLSRFGLPGLWASITPCSDLGLRRGRKQSCSSL